MDAEMTSDWIVVVIVSVNAVIILYRAWSKGR